VNSRDFSEKIQPIGFIGAKLSLDFSSVTLRDTWQLLPQEWRKVSD
jgi:hypothetical protein